MVERAWLYLIGAGIFEIAWAIALKYSETFSRPMATIFTLVAMILSFVLLARALETLPLGTAYVVWTGIGAVGTVALGMWLFNEPRDLLRLACIALVIAGILGLKITGAPVR